MSSSKSETTSLTYADAGVDIAAGDKAVQFIKSHVQSTYRKEVVGDIGGFGGLFALDWTRYRQPLLVSSTDGVGTKSFIAQQLGRLDTPARRHHRHLVYLWFRWFDASDGDDGAGQ